MCGQMTHLLGTGSDRTCMREPGRVEETPCRLLLVGGFDCCLGSRFVSQSVWAEVTTTQPTSKGGNTMLDAAGESSKQSRSCTVLTS